MEIYTLERELLTSPRQLRRRGTRGYGTVFSYFIVIPLMLMTLGMVVWEVHMLTVRIAGPVVACTIDGHSTSRDSKGKPLFYVAYSYRAKGREFHARQNVPIDVYDNTRIGSAGQVQISPLFPGQDSALLLTGVGVWDIPILFGFTSLFLCGVIALMVWSVVVMPMRRKALVVEGTPVAGRLVDKVKYVGSKSASYTLYYEYQAGDNGPTFAGKQSTRPDVFETAVVGKTYTVLYNPARPKLSVLYQFGDFEAL